MQIRAYLDNNATTRPHADVVEVTRFFQETLYLNASSVAGELLGAARPLGEARAAMLDLLGGVPDSDRIIFTSGASEANGWVMFGVLPPGSHIVTCATEHSSILAAVRGARARGHWVDLATVDRNGVVDPESFAAALRPDTRLVSIQFANNETGVLQPLAELAALARARAPAALIHTDATQAVGRVPIDLTDELAEIDLLSFSAHKFHGPKGIGGIFMREGLRIEPLIPGEQEWGLRGGTSNVPAVAGLGVAARHAKTNLECMAGVGLLRDQLEARLLAARPDARMHSLSAPRLPNTSSIAIPGIEADEVVEQLALGGICLSTGSACLAGATSPSHVLTAMGLDVAQARSTLRISLSVQTTEAEVEQALAALIPLLGEIMR